MKNSNNKEIIKWVNTWKRASISLARVKRSELQSKDYYQKNQMLINDMLQYAFDHRRIRFNSGLIEQQQIFMKMKERQV